MRLRQYRQYGDGGAWYTMTMSLLVRSCWRPTALVIANVVECCLDLDADVWKGQVGGVTALHSDFEWNTMIWEGGQRNQRVNACNASTCTHSKLVTTQQKSTQM